MAWTKSGTLVAPSAGVEIDSAESTIQFDVKAVGTTLTDVPGLSIMVPAAEATQPYYIDFTCPTQISPGTAAINTFVQIGIYILDLGGAAYGFGVASGQQGSATSAALNLGNSIAITRRVDPHPTVDRTYKAQAKTMQAVPANWSAALLLANAAPDTGFYAPMLLRAWRAG